MYDRGRGGVSVKYNLNVDVYYFGGRVWENGTLCTAVKMLNTLPGPVKAWMYMLSVGESSK